MIPRSDQRMKTLSCKRRLSATSYSRLRVNEAKTTEIQVEKDRKREFSFEQRPLPIDNARKMRKNDMPLFIAVLRHDAILRSQKYSHKKERVDPGLQHIKISAENTQYLRSYHRICIYFMTSFLKN